jgi:hypothetical protein
MTGNPRNMVVDMLLEWNRVFVIGVICLEIFDLNLESMYSLL